MTDNELLTATKQALDAEQRELELRAQRLAEKQKRLQKTNQLQLPKELTDDLETQKAKLCWEEAQGKTAAGQLSSVGLILGIGAVVIGVVALVMALSGGIFSGGRNCITSMGSAFAECNDCPDSDGRCGGDNTCKPTTINNRGPYQCYKVGGNGKCYECSK
jgi:hypothetical protein